MRLLLCLFITFFSINIANAQVTLFESKTNYSASYAETIAYYKSLDETYKEAKLLEVGKTDIGKPLHLFLISKSAEFSPEKFNEQRKCVLLINNGIHPGEPCGIDASMMFARNLLSQSNTRIPDNVVIAIVPVYNVGGALNRGSFSRANQDGPMEYGFRGNARNLDLNRDFIKCDSENAKSFIRIMQLLKPHVFIDTHTTDGADYQATMTLIPTQKDKIHPSLSNYMETTMNPYLYSQMNDSKWKMCPYVNTIGETPEDGISGFLETGRYSSGYAALFNTIAYISEAHMLKPFSDRVYATYHLLNLLLRKTDKDAEKIFSLRTEADKLTMNQKEFAIKWDLDKDNNKKIVFEGFEAEKVNSNVTGHKRIRYNTEKPFKKEISLFNDYKASKKITLPYAYIIPQAWKEVIERLKWNGIATKVLDEDKNIEVTTLYIDKFKSLEWAYEGHHLNHETTIKTQRQQIYFYKGDVIVYTNQIGNRFLSTVLEPESPDSYFSWNFFDGIIMQKEYFSGFVFDDTAENLLADNAELKAEFEKKKSEDDAFVKNHRRQLDWIYKRSPYYEDTHLRYPVFRIENEDDF